MVKRIAGFALLMMMLAVCVQVSAQETFDMSGEGTPDAAYCLYEDMGEVIYAQKNDAGARIAAKGFFGYHLADNPSMTIGVCLDAAGKIEQAFVLESDAQTPGFAEMITGAYLERAYVGKDASGVQAVDAVAGATATSTAVNYAVRAALAYAQSAYGLTGDATAAELSLLNQYYPGAYAPIETDYVVDAKKYGTVLFAAEDERTVAMKIQSSKKVNYKHSSDTGWPSAEPSPYTMLIYVDKASRHVVSSCVLVDGTKRPEYFTVPAEKYDAYNAVEIVVETAFDDFSGGLVREIDAEMSKDDMGFSIITGTSVIFTGVSDDGTFSSQLVRHCFQTAARFFCQYA